MSHNHWEGVWGWPMPEPPHRISRTYLEPILFEYAAAMPGHPAVSSPPMTLISNWI
jgi:hypothetical protein